MTPLATIAELRDFLDDQSIPTSRAEKLLEDVSDQVRRYCGISFDLVTSTDVKLDGTGTEVILLPEVPVVEVTTLLEGDSVLVAGRHYEWSADGIIRRLGGRFVRRFRYYAISYRHGYAEIPPAVKGVVLRVAARGIRNPEGLTQESVASYSVGYGYDETRFSTLSATDRRILDGFRR